MVHINLLQGSLFNFNKEAFNNLSDYDQIAKEQLLEEINSAVHDAGSSINKKTADQYRQKYRLLLENAEKECPPLMKYSEQANVDV